MFEGKLVRRIDVAQTDLAHPRKDHLDPFRFLKRRHEFAKSKLAWTDMQPMLLGVDRAHAQPRRAS